jgi:prevent-host-death family protein
MEYGHVGVREARARLADLLDDAEQGSITLITRHGRAAGAIIPAALLDQLGQPGPAVESAVDALRGALAAIEPLLPRPTATWSAHESRPGRPALVIDSLGSLRGPASGVAELPLRLFWSAPDRTFDMSKPFMVRSMYEAVLGEAATAEDLADWLDRGTLIRLWPDLYLPKGIRRAWEERHPVLAGAGERAA